MRIRPLQPTQPTHERGASVGGAGVGEILQVGSDAYETVSANERSKRARRTAKQELKERGAQRLSNENIATAQLSAQEKALQAQLSAGASASAQQNKILQQYVPTGLMALMVLGVFWFLKK